MLKTLRNRSCCVVEAEAFVLQAPLSSPFRIATGRHDVLENVFLRLRLESGATGFGEAAIATHITGETVPLTLSNLKRVAAKLIGYDISSPLVVGMEFRPYFKNNHAGLAAFEMAVLDAYAREQKVPFWRLFAQKLAGRKAVLSTDITIVIGSLEETAEAAARHAARGFRTFKVKVGRDDKLDFRRVLKIKELVPGATILLDANQSFTAERMLRFIKRLHLEAVYPVLVEQPVPKKDWAGLKRVTQALRESGPLVCADESVGSFAEAAYAIQTESVSAINIKFMKSGILESAEIARIARTKGIELMIGAMMESSLAITAAAHFAAALACFRFVDLDTTYFIKGRLGHSPFLDSRGRFDLTPAGPGIGVSVGGCVR